MANVAAATTGGSSPSKRSPVSGSSAETRGEPHEPRRQHGGQPAVRYVRHRWDQYVVRCDKTFLQTIDPQTPVRVQHHFNDAGIFEIAGDGRTERRAEHARRVIQTALGDDGWP